MDPRDFLTTAIELANKTSATKADLRTAISRTYYAAFNAALEHLAKLNQAWERLNHGEVVRYLSNSGNVDIERAGNLLGRLHSLRIIADYRMLNSRPENKNTVVLWIRRTRNIVDLLDQHCHGSTVANRIREYERKVGSR